MLKKILFLLLGLSFLGFLFDFFHLAYHLYRDPDLWHIPGVFSKAGIKILSFLIPFYLLLNSKVWLKWIIIVLLVSAGTFHLNIGQAWADSDCQHAREMLDQAGTARDVNEDFLGNIHRKPPYGTFPSDMDQITWWGVFKPFEFWHSPEFQATWINPDGIEVARQNFRAGHCRLAKTSLYGPAQPRGEFKGGMWKVIVTCDDYLIDRQTFAVIAPNQNAPSGPDAKGKSQEPMMIWAEDLTK